MAFTLPPLPYDTKALEPHIDAATMEIHHDKHHNAYVTNLNNALAEHSALQSKTLPELMAMVNELPEAIRTAVRNNGGGHINHTMFWSIMGPNGGAPTGKVAEAITRDFGDFETLQTKFNEAGTKQFGSGWVFVTLDAASGKLAIVAKPNQDTPLMEGKSVLFGNDVWEHAYYLKYQNRRPDYLKAWWNTVSWSAVQARYDAIVGGSIDPSSK